MKEKTILVYAQNERGVLERIMMLIRQKRYNLEQITASDTEKRHIKQITITFSDVDKKFQQVMKQIKKIVEVIEVIDVSGDKAIKQEVAFIKIKNPEKLSLLNKIIKKEDIDLIYSNDEHLILRAVGSSDFIQEFKNSLKDFKILEFASSGSVTILKN